MGAAKVSIRMWPASTLSARSLRSSPNAFLAVRPGLGVLRFFFVFGRAADIVETQQVTTVGTLDRHARARGPGCGLRLRRRRCTVLRTRVPQAGFGCRELYVSSA